MRFIFVYMCTLAVFASQALTPGAVVSRNKPVKRPHPQKKKIESSSQGAADDATVAADYIRRTDDKQLLEQFHQNLPDEKKAKEAYNQAKKDMQHEVSTKSSSVTISEMNYDQLLVRKNELIVTGDYGTALKYLQRMLPLSESPQQQIFIMLELAELFMKTGDYHRAEIAFIDFAKLYPSNEFVEQAYVKAIECSSLQTATADRDQTKTEETLALINDFISREAIYSRDSVQEVLKIKHECLTKLAQSKVGIAQQYIGRRVYSAAHKRLDDLRAVDLLLLPELEPTLLSMEFQLADAEGNSSVALSKQKELMQKYPEHELTVALSAPKKSWFSWFGSSKKQA